MADPDPALPLSHLHILGVLVTPGVPEALLPSHGVLHDKVLSGVLDAWATRVEQQLAAAHAPKRRVELIRGLVWTGRNFPLVETDERDGGEIDGISDAACAWFMSRATETIFYTPFEWRTLIKDATVVVLVSHGSETDEARSPLLANILRHCSLPARHGRLIAHIRLLDNGETESISLPVVMTERIPKVHTRRMEEEEDAMDLDAAEEEDRPSQKRRRPDPMPQDAMVITPSSPVAEEADAPQ